MNEKLYRIGEVSKILNIPVSTLRYYDKLGLVVPAYTDKSSDYRYYAENQFQYIDRIRYLQNLDLSLEEIRDIMEQGSPEHLMPYLEKQKRRLLEKISDIQKKIGILDWYINYFSYAVIPTDKEIYERRISKRQILAVASDNRELPTTSDMKLLSVKNLPGLSKLTYRREWGCLLDYEAMMKNLYIPTYTFNTLNEFPDFESKYFMTLPAGIYICFKTRLFEKDFTLIPHIREYFKKPNISPGRVIAVEYENNFHEYLSSLYEIQIEVKFV